MLSQWFEIITTCITLACLCRCPCYRSPESNSIFRNERRNRHVCRCCIINRQRLRKILRFHRHYYSLPETTNAANYATTRAANRTSTTRLLLTIIYYFFPPSPRFETCHEQSLLSLSILLYPERKGYATFQRQCRSRPVSSW